MKRSDSRILTTHTGSLPRPPDLVALLNAKELGETYDRGGVRRAHRARDRRRRAAAGRYRHRRGRRRRAQQGQLDGLCAGAARPGSRRSTRRCASAGHARLRRVRRRLRGHEGDAGGALGRASSPKRTRAAEGAGLLRPDQLCRPRRGARRHREPEGGARRRRRRRRRSSPRSRRPTSSSITRTATTPPTRNISRRSPTRCTRNTRRSSTPASCCRSTIRAWRRTTTARADASIEDCRKFIALRVEAVNHALRGIPADRVRFHTCYSVNIAPRVHDFELRHFVDLMLKINAVRLSDRGARTRATSTNGRSGRR